MNTVEQTVKLYKDWMCDKNLNFELTYQGLPRSFTGRLKGMKDYPVFAAEIDTVMFLFFDAHVLETFQREDGVIFEIPDFFQRHENGEIKTNQEVSNANNKGK